MTDFNRADRTWTCNLSVPNRTLYQLSYARNELKFKWHRGTWTRNPSIKSRLHYPFMLRIKSWRNLDSTWEHQNWTDSLSHEPHMLPYTRPPNATVLVFSRCQLITLIIQYNFVLCMNIYSMNPLYLVQQQILLPLPCRLNISH